jgi:hypothetical protein
MPSSSPLFENQTQADLEAEMLADLYANQADLQDRLENTMDPGERHRLVVQLSSIARALGESEAAADDPLVDEWERDLAEGRMPDLEKGLKK